jgi:hypothetical protein
MPTGERSFRVLNLSERSQAREGEGDVLVYLDRARPTIGFAQQIQRATEFKILEFPRTLQLPKLFCMSAIIRFEVSPARPVLAPCGHWKLNVCTWLQESETKMSFC